MTNNPDYEFESNNGAVLTLCGTNPAYYKGQIAWVPLAEEGVWQITLDAVAIQGSPITYGPANAAVDTGASLISGPSLPVLHAYIYFFLHFKINQAIEAQLYDCTSFSQLPQIIFSIGNYYFVLSGSDYMNQDGYSCSPGFGVVPSGAPTQWILGDVFIRTFYTIFDRGNARVGFAEAA
ncbi:eukaryotic aspartyl protease [Ostertagia ostertagi]